MKNRSFFMMLVMLTLSQFAFSGLKTIDQVRPNHFYLMSRGEWNFLELRTNLYDPTMHTGSVCVTVEGIQHCNGGHVVWFKDPIVRGDKYPVTVTFSDGSSKELEVIAQDWDFLLQYWDRRLDDKSPETTEWIRTIYQGHHDWADDMLTEKHAVQDHFSQLEADAKNSDEGCNRDCRKNLRGQRTSRAGDLMWAKRDYRARAAEITLLARKHGHFYIAPRDSESKYILEYDPNSPFPGVSTVMKYGQEPLSKLVSRPDGVGHAASTLHIVSGDVLEYEEGQDDHFASKWAAPYGKVSRFKVRFYNAYHRDIYYDIWMYAYGWNGCSRFPINTAIGCNSKQTGYRDLRFGITQEELDKLPPVVYRGEGGYEPFYYTEVEIKKSQWTRDINSYLYPTTFHIYRR